MLACFAQERNLGALPPLPCRWCSGYSPAFAAEKYREKRSTIVGLRPWHNRICGFAASMPRRCVERIESASALPDPKFQVELMDFTNAMTPGKSASGYRARWDHPLPGHSGVSISRQTRACGAMSRK